MCTSEGESTALQTKDRRADSKMLSCLPWVNTESDLLCCQPCLHTPPPSWPASLFYCHAAEDCDAARRRSPTVSLERGIPVFCPFFYFSCSTNENVRLCNFSLNFHGLMRAAAPWLHSAMSTAIACTSHRSVKHPFSLRWEVRGGQAHGNLTDHNTKESPYCISLTQHSSSLTHSFHRVVTCHWVIKHQLI